MPYRNMTAKELAKLLGVDSRRVEQLAQRGKIPCQRIRGEYRFNRAQITQWLQQKMSTMSSDNLAGLDAGLSAQRQAQQDDAIITSLLRIEAVTPNLGSRTKNSTLRSLVALAQDTGLVYDEDALLQAVMHREELCSTAMDHGIAIPHPRSPLPYDIVEPILVVARTTQGICFGGSDGRRSNLFFLIASQDDSHHLHVLARLCRMLQDESLIIQLNSAKTAQDLIQLLSQRERDVIADSG